MPVKRSIAALAIVFGVSGCGATIQTQAQIPTRPILQTGDKISPEADATKKHRGMRRAKKLTRLFNALAAKDPTVKADLDQLKTRLLGLGKDQMKALHALMWEQHKTMTLDQLRLKLQGFLDAPSTFATHVKTNLDKLQAMSAADIAALNAQFPPGTIKQLAQMMREARKAEEAKPGQKEAGMAEGAAEAEDDDDEDMAAPDAATKTPDTAAIAPATPCRPAPRLALKRPRLHACSIPTGS